MRRRRESRGVFSRILSVLLPVAEQQARTADDREQDDCQPEADDPVERHVRDLESPAGSSRPRRPATDLMRDQLCRIDQIMNNHSVYGYSHFGSIQALSRIPPRSAKDAGSGTILRHDRVHFDGRCSGIRRRWATPRAPPTASGSARVFRRKQSTPVFPQQGCGGRVAPRAAHPAGNAHVRRSPSSGARRGVSFTSG